MIRTQVSLDRMEYQRARAEAARLGISFADLVRRALRSVLPVEARRPWMKYAGMIETGDGKSSRTIDDVVYGRKP